MMLQQSNVRKDRRGVAAIEFAVVFPFMMLIILGIWELGRIIQVQQVMMMAARNGARLAAQAYIVNTVGSYTQITSNGFDPANPSPTAAYPNVYATMSDTLIGNNITNLNNAVMNFTFLSGDLTRQPYQGNKNEAFLITLILPYDNVRWTTLSLFNPNEISVQVQWQMLVDSPFTVSTTLPGWSP